MSSAYSLDQYVGDLRAITAKETDPVRITELVAPLARKFAQAPGWFRPEYRECDVEQGFGVHLLHEEPNHDLAVFLLSWHQGLVSRIPHIYSDKQMSRKLHIMPSYLITPFIY